MARIRGLLLFYRLFFFTPGFLLTLIACGLYYRNAGYHNMPIGSVLFGLKVLTLGLTLWLISLRKERYFFFNFRLTNLQLLAGAGVIDLFLYCIVMKITQILL